MGDMADLLMEYASDEWALDEYSGFDWYTEIRAVGPSTWLTADGTRVKIRDMETAHLVNVLNLLMRQPKMSKAAGGARRVRLKAEARKRGCPEVRPGVWRTPPADDFEHVGITRGLSI